MNINRLYNCAENWHNLSYKYYKKLNLLIYCFGVRTKDGDIIWGIQFPLDFKGVGENNNNHKALVELQTLMDFYSGSVFAFGDFNTIKGNITDSMYLALRPEYKFNVPHTTLTFFGAHYDTIPNNGTWQLIA